MLRSFISHSLPQRYYEADKGDNPPATDPVTEPKTGNDPVKTEKTFSQADVDAIVKDRIAREKRKADETAEKAKTEAEQKALLEKGEFKTLAEQRATELETLRKDLEAAKTHEQTADKYRKALKERLDAEKKNFPAHVVSLLDKLDPLEQMEWITTNAEALKPASDTRQLGTPPRNAANNGARNTNAPANPNRTADDDNRPRFTLG